jgi:hypothetical protein
LEHSGELLYPVLRQFQSYSSLCMAKYPQLEQTPHLPPPKLVLGSDDLLCLVMVPSSMLQVLQPPCIWYLFPLDHSLLGCITTCYAEKATTIKFNYVCEKELRFLGFSYGPCEKLRSSRWVLRFSSNARSPPGLYLGSSMTFSFNSS